ncbi:MAG TPA: Uma2 family endonuclease [Sandaracinaceae bacterium LLY-WYZ-13_1]|nr:Uma2 family endonuclease [Sandaracinaceae bacterium LLY-WYZ-13_1]
MAELARRVPVEEYLALDEASDLRHEYLNGFVVAMAGASPRHNRVVGNVITALNNALRDSKCGVFDSGQRVRVSATGGYVYPDAVVTCDTPIFTDERPRSLENPLLVVEVLSKTTRDRDEGAKLGHYRRVASVQEVLVVDANERRVAHYRRLETGQWIITDLTEGAVELPCVDATLDLETLYAKTDDLPRDES